MGKITKYLNQLIVGNVFDNQEILDFYSTDRSVLKIKPKFVAFPESTEDIQKLMRFFNQLAQKDIKVALTARGGGNDIGGADLSNGLIISMEKLNHLLEIDSRERLVRVQAGITLKELNTALSVSGLNIPICGYDNYTIGGLISSCAVDDFEERYGGIKKFVDRIEVVLANGDCLQTRKLKKYAAAKIAAEKTFEGEIYRKMAKLIKENEKLIKSIDNDNRNLAGYSGITGVYRHEVMDLMPIFFGAEGTLGIISEVILKAVPIPKKPARIVATFKDIETAVKYAELVKELKPQKLNFYDLKIVMKARDTGKNLDGVIRRLEDGFVVYATFDERRNYNLKKVKAISSNFPRSSKFIFENIKNRLMFNELENSLTNYLSYVKDGERVPVITDFYLPSYNIKGFVDDLKILSNKLEFELELFGSFNNSIYSLRPKFDLEDQDFNKKIVTFLRAGSYIINRQDGVLTGGSTEGRLKAIISNAEMQESELSLYSGVKKIFDKNGIVNPDIKLGVSSRFTLTHFRDTNQLKIMV